MNFGRGGGWSTQKTGSGWLSPSSSALRADATYYWPLYTSSTEIVTGVSATDTDITYSAGAAVLNGSTSVITTTLFGPLHAAVRSVSAWFKPASLQQRYVLGYGASSTRAGFGVLLDPGGVTQVDWYGASLNGPTYTAGAWNNIVATYDGTAVDCWVNGVHAAATATVVLDTLATLPIRFGKGEYGPYDFFAGSIRDVGVWPRVLTQTEVGKINSGAVWPFVGT